MTKNCKFAGCQKELPIGRRGNRDYCDNKCYSAAKRIRDITDYGIKSGWHKKYKKNINILNFLLPISQLIPIIYLDKNGFDWDTHDGQKYINNSKEIAFVIGDIAFRIVSDNNKNFVKIWKFQC